MPGVEVFITRLEHLLFEKTKHRQDGDSIIKLTALIF